MEPGGEERLAVGVDLGNNQGAGGPDQTGLHFLPPDEGGIRSEQQRSVHGTISLEESR